MKAITIHDLPRIEKPREKLDRYGASKLNDYELLAILLRTGRKGKNVIEISKEIIKKFGPNLKDANLVELSKISGIGNAKATEIIACFELGKRFSQNKPETFLTPKDIWNSLTEIRNQKKEHFVAVFLDSRNTEIKREVISIGTINTSLVHPREVFEPAVRLFANSVMLVHNHPSGNPEPSNADLEITKRLIASGKILGINILDHVIVTSDSWHSMKENGYLNL
jgi:DNA repair protein RadC